jgi:hypothetical protein
VRDLLPVAGWLAGRGGRPEGYCHRQMIDAIRYLVDNGIVLLGSCPPKGGSEAAEVAPRPDSFRGHSGKCLDQTLNGTTLTQLTQWQCHGQIQQRRTATVV